MFYNITIHTLVTMTLLRFFLYLDGPRSREPGDNYTRQRSIYAYSHLQDSNSILCICICICVCIYIYIYIYTQIHVGEGVNDLHHTVALISLRDKDLYTTTNKCLQCLIKIMYTVFQLIGVYV